jgi:hypothetical protein
MDDGQVVIPYDDLIFFLDRITTLGPSFGLSLELNKTVLLTSTSGISPRPFLSVSHQQDLDYCIKTYTNPQNETLDGVDFLGYPIGHPDFMTQSLTTTDEQLTSDTHELFTNLPSLQTSTTLFKHCLLTCLPYQAYTDVLTSPLPATHTDPHCRQTAHTRRVDRITKTALSYSTGHENIPAHVVQLAQLPTRHGGLGFFHAKYSTSASFISQAIR